MDDLSAIADALASETPQKPVASKILPSSGVWASLDREVQQALEGHADEVSRFIVEGIQQAVSYIKNQRFTQEEMIGLWTLLESAHRTALRKHGL